MSPIHAGGSGTIQTSSHRPRSIRVKVPCVNDGKEDFHTLALLWNQVLSYGKADFLFDFSDCDYLRPNAVVVLGGLIRQIQQIGGESKLLLDTMDESVRINLAQNSFIRSMGGNIQPWSGQSIHYREDQFQDKDVIVNRYLRPQWIGKGWINVSADLQNELASQLWEVYANAFEHSRSELGVFSCGQRYAIRKEVVLVVADFGVGIPHNARMNNGRGYTGQDAMQWAFSRGTTSAALPSNTPRGVGLDLLKEFVRKNRGSLDVYSHEGHARIDAETEKYEDLQNFFRGTLVQVRLSCDDHYYQLSGNEDVRKPYF